MERSPDWPQQRSVILWYFGPSIPNKQALFGSCRGRATFAIITKHARLTRLNKYAIVWPQQRAATRTAQPQLNRRLCSTITGEDCPSVAANRFARIKVILVDAQSAFHVNNCKKHKRNAGIGKDSLRHRAMTTVFTKRLRMVWQRQTDL